MILLASPSQASGDHGTVVLDDALGDYMAVALAFWGGPAPVCVLHGRTVVPVHAVMFDDPDPAVAASADQPGCRLWLDRDYWGRQDPVEACTVIVHEWGHMLGYGHSANPLSTMAESPTRPPPGCLQFARTARHPRLRACARSCRRLSPSPARVPPGRRR